MPAMRWLVAFLGLSLVAAPALASTFTEAIPVAAGTTINDLIVILKGDVRSQISNTMNPFGSGGTLATSLDGGGDTELVFSPSSPLVVGANDTSLLYGVESAAFLSVLDVHFDVSGGTLSVPAYSATDTPTGGSEYLILYAQDAVSNGASEVGQYDEMPIPMVSISQQEVTITIDNDQANLLMLSNVSYLVSNSYIPLNALSSAFLSAPAPPFIYPALPEIDVDRLEQGIQPGSGITDPIPPTPEPSTFALWGLSCAALVALKRRKKLRERLGVFTQGQRFQHG